MIILFVGPEMVESRLSGYSFKDKEGNKSAGEIGDLFSGTTTPLIAIIGCVLTFIAFYIQYQANKEQRAQFRNQGLDTARERFENRYFEMIRLHRANVEELDIQDVVKGRKAFTPMYFEFKYIYVCLSDEYLRQKRQTDNQEYTIQIEDKKKITNIAYLIFFFGINDSSKFVYADLLPAINQESFFIATIAKLTRIQDTYNNFDIRHRSNHFEELSYSFNNANLKTRFLFIYKPFAGQGQKLGHYFRHVFQTVKYVNNQDEKQIPLHQKKEYLMTLRGQLSNFEQIFFYYNACSVLGKPWIETGLLVKYQIIKNMPLAFVDFGIYPKEKFSQKEYDLIEFDWNKISNES